MESNDSPEIPDRRGTSDIDPLPPFGGWRGMFTTIVTEVIYQPASGASLDAVIIKLFLLFL